MTHPAEHYLTTIYTERDQFAGVTGRRRKQLLLLHRAFHGPFDALHAASVLDLDIKPTRRLLASLADSGWLARVRRGWYIGVPIDASAPGEWREDPWVVATTLFFPGYIGGWSAVEHWGLSDQIFNVIYVVAGRKVAQTRQTVQGTDFLIRTVPERTLFGTRRVWRRSVPVNVADPHRTVIDILDLPSSAGGVLHAAEVLQAYFASEHADQAKLLDYGDRLGRGSVFKRLGYLTERMDLSDADFLKACRGRVTKGVSRLDPGGPARGRIVARWNIRVNTWRLAPEEEDGS